MEGIILLLSLQCIFDIFLSREKSDNIIHNAFMLILILSLLLCFKAKDIIIEYKQMNVWADKKLSFTIFSIVLTGYIIIFGIAYIMLTENIDATYTKMFLICFFMEGLLFFLDSYGCVLHLFNEVKK